MNQIYCACFYNQWSRTKKEKKEEDDNFFLERQRTWEHKAHPDPTESVFDDGCNRSYEKSMKTDYILQDGSDHGWLVVA